MSVRPLHEVRTYDIGKLNFLIIDDNRHMRSLVKGVLRALGAGECYEAADGADGLKMLQNHSPDIVITDWNMDPLDGLDFTRLVRSGKDSTNPYVPIIMVTGHTELNRVTEARDAGVNEFLAKPVSARGIYSRILAVIERPRDFVKTKDYFGPCRKRKMDANYNGPERRGSMAEISENRTDGADDDRAPVRPASQDVRDLAG